MSPFVIFGLPRSRTTWLSRFLTYGDWVCGHEEIRHCRSLDDVKAWFSQPNIGTAETAGAPWWRLLERVAPGAKIMVVRRPVNDVFDSLMRLGGCSFDPIRLKAALHKLNRKLDQIEARLPCLSVKFADLEDAHRCADIFEYCLGEILPFDHWQKCDAINVQIDMRALMRFAEAYRPQLDKLASVAKHRILTDMALREPVEPEGITIQAETFDDWVRDGTALFDEHLVQVGEAPGDWQGKNLSLMRRLYDLDAMQIMTARCNGRMFGYLMTLITPSLVSEKIKSAANTTFYASPEFPGLGLKLQRAAVAALKKRGIDELFLQAGVRGSGERTAAIYRRLGAEDNGRFFRLQLTGA